ncbi:MAG: DUF3422 family protein [Tepidimonas sp.]|uniref:DUF3422 family protein n=1 Tax=Tepidimonas sp. TaxID=2002775 RepID=UPI004054E94B
MDTTIPPGAAYAHAATRIDLLPPDDSQRVVLHDEVHARPPARIRLPALVVYVAVANDGISREDEWAHLCALPGQRDLPLAALNNNFLRLRLSGFTLKWERHTEFTRYSLVQPLPAHAGLGSTEPVLFPDIAVPVEWLRGIPGRVLAAIELALISGALDHVAHTLAQAKTWFGGHPVVASLIGWGESSLLVTDLRLRETGFERMLVVCPPGTSETRVGRIAARLVEIETYRIMALRGLPVAKALAPMLLQSERALADITAQLDAKTTDDQQLLDTLVAEAARIERAIAEHAYRFSATRAYHDLVRQRLTELREQPIPGTQTLGEFMQRRLSPAIATVAATAERLASLSERIARTSALLRTRVDIVREAQNQLLLAKLTRGQELQLRLQSTVEGLSIAAISYYVVSLLLYLGKALKGVGVPLNPELAAGAMIPLVWWAVRRTTRRIHKKLHAASGARPPA